MGIVFILFYCSELIFIPLTGAGPKVVRTDPLRDGCTGFFLAVFERQPQNGNATEDQKTSNDPESDEEVIGKTLTDAQRLRRKAKKLKQKKRKAAQSPALDPSVEPPSKRQMANAN
jgi:hypothetical protein